MIMGFAQEAFEPGATEEGTTQDELAELVAAFPHLGAMAMAEPHDQTDSLSVRDTRAEFEFTLGLILDGLGHYRVGSEP